MYLSDLNIFKMIPLLLINKINNKIIEGQSTILLFPLNIE